MAKPRFKVTIVPKNISAQLGMARRRLRPRVRQLVTELANFGVTTMKTLVPIRSGRLRDSIKVMGKSAGGGFDLRSTVFIGSNLPYAAAQDTGSRPSSGRYVPVLGRRIQSGRHPGIKGRDFSRETTRRILEKSTSATQRMISRWRGDLRRSG